jgi:hypothetical protein
MEEGKENPLMEAANKIALDGKEPEPPERKEPEAGSYEKFMGLFGGRLDKREVV